MFRRFTRVIALLSFLIATTTLPATAQTPVASSLPEPGELTGIQQAVVRTWGIDFVAIATATPDYQPDILSNDLTILGGFILEFDTSANAADAFDRFKGGIAGELRNMDVTGNAPILEEDLVGVGDQALSATLLTTTDQYEAAVRYVLVQDGPYVFLTMAIANSEDHAVAANDLASWLANHRKSFTSDTVFDESGHSTGGLWDFFPRNDHELVSGLIPISDEVLYPESAA